MENGWMDWIEWMWKVDVDVESGCGKWIEWMWRVARFRISHSA